MANIIVFGNQKGGIGKSTCSLLCANALSQGTFNYKVLIIDADHQQSLSDARRLDQDSGSKTFPYEIIEMSISDIEQNIAKLDQEYDFIFIDVAGKMDTNTPIDQQETTRILMYTDWLFIPFKAGSFNLDASLRYIKLILQVAAMRQQSERTLNIRGFVNMYRSRHRMNRYLLEDIQQIKEVSQVNFMRAYLNQYTLFEDIDTFTTIYNDKSRDNAKVNFVIWLNELIRTIAS